MPPLPPPKAGPPAVPTFSWDRAPITVAYVKSGVTCRARVSVWVCGTVAVYESRVWKGKHVLLLTSVPPTGVFTGLFATDMDARKAGEVLLRECGGALRNSVKTELEAALPGWVRPWLQECRRVTAYVDPTPYRKAKSHQGE